MRRMLAQADMEGKSLYAVCSRSSLGRDPFLTGLAASGCYRKQLRQLRNVHRDPSRLILAEQLGGRASPRLILEIDIGKLLPGAVRHDESSAAQGGGQRRAAEQSSYFDF